MTFKASRESRASRDSETEKDEFEAAISSQLAKRGSIDEECACAHIAPHPLHRDQLTVGWVSSQDKGGSRI